MNEIRKTNPRGERFWSEIAPREHSVQIYGEDNAFIDALEGYVSSGLRRSDGVIVIATAPHLHELEKRLRANWLDVDRARWEERYIALLAQETLSLFMVDGKPDEHLFTEAMERVIVRARGRSGRTVRAFGEMVALLWTQGHPRAAMELEALWNRLQEAHEFALFCGYPRSAFGSDVHTSLRGVCAVHTRIIPGYTS